ncbi:LysM peptidoglycan-binding domain-containing protein [Planococcus beigongshangi]|uniref:LysM peptidoglycan-binding domain-containing protein n=1 Tax=Planococcus beigongshangi TaxID=2782536 RepID=UPI00193B430F|nr:LysM peptidoglycan-binding domain-containing protein [Planococcus beigongshangi]
MKKHIVALTAVAALSVGAATAASADSNYTVKSGDTLWAISQANNVSVSDLKGWNDLSSDLIFPNQQLSIGGETQKEEKAAVASSSYTVQSGDTLYRIAVNHGISLDQLMSWNGITGHLIYPGDKLVVSGGTPISVPKAPAQSSTPAPAQSTAPAKTSAPAPAAQSGKEMQVSATAYTAYCAGCSGITATGIDLRSNPNQKVIAVDPTVIPLGSTVWVEGYGTAIAGDTGGAIKGNKIDVFIPSRDAALQWGRKTVTIKILK